MKFDVKSRFTGAVQFTADIDCEDDAPRAIKLGLAVKWAMKAGADLRGAYLWGADLAGADLRGADLAGADLADANLWGADLAGANLRGAYLAGADLWGAHGINDYVKCIQIDTYPITYTAEVIQIGCERHTHQEWAEFDDARILRMDGSNALTWWRKYKAWLFQTIEMCPAKPTGTVAEEATAAE